MPQSNLDQLKMARVIPDNASLTAAELSVIDGLSAKELKCLIDIRERLAEAATSGETKLTTGTLTPNIIL